MARLLAVFFACSVALAMPITFAGCGSDDDGEDEPDPDHEHDASKPVGPPSGAKCPTNSTLTYDNFAKGFFQEYCLRCHSESVKGDARMNAPADHNFDTLAEIEILAPHIDQMAAAGESEVNETMPPSTPKPSLEMRKKLGEWIACDLKE